MQVTDQKAANRSVQRRRLRALLAACIAALSLPWLAGIAIAQTAPVPAAAPAVPASAASAPEAAVPQAAATAPEAAASQAAASAPALEVSAPQPAASAAAAAASSPQAAASAPLPAVPLTAHTVLPSAGLLADVALLEEAYKALHPGLYRYNTPQQIDADFAALRAKFSRGRTLGEAYLALSRFAAKIRCGHSYANFFNQSKAVQQALFRAPRLPFDFEWVADARSAPRMIVTRAYVDDARLRPGTEVLVLNDVLVTTVLERLLPLARADGSNDAKRIDQMQRQSRERIAAFDVFYPLLFPWPRGSAPRVSLVVRQPGSSMLEPLDLPALSAQQDDARIAALQPADKDAPQWTLEFRGDASAVLRMPSWALYNSRWDWKDWLAQAFAQLAASQTQDLVIDIRGNEGGLTVGEELLRYVVTQPLALADVTRMTRYRSVPAPLRPYLDTWDDSFYDWGDAAQPAGEGYYRLTKYDDDARGLLITPAAPHFAGRVWVLVDAADSSATFEFAQIVQQHSLGTLVGASTGGNQRGINGGAFFFLRLPNSHIEMDLPLIATFPQGNPADAGLQPEVPVTTTVNDIAQGRDAAMAAVEQRIRLARKPLAAR